MPFIDMTIKITADNIDKVMEDLNEELERGLEKVGQVAEGDVSKMCVVDTGRLRNSISHSTKANPSNKSYSWKDSTKGRDTKAGTDTTESHGGEMDAKVYVGTNVTYAEHVEYGTSKMEAQPFLRPAIQKNLHKYRKILESELYHLNEKKK